MSEHIQNWVNQHLKLSKFVTDLEKDFANGYLFAEILSKHHFLDIYRFSNKDQVNDKLNNFKLLEPVFKGLGVDFDSNIAEAIIKQEKGIAGKVLSQLRTALDKTRFPRNLTSIRKLGNSLRQSPMILSPGRTETVQLTQSSHILSMRLYYQEQSPKETLLASKLSKFREFRLKSIEKADAEAFKAWEIERKIRDRRRRAGLRKLRKLMEQREIAESKGWNEWEKYRQRKIELEQKEKEFYIGSARKTQEKAIEAYKKEIEETIQELDFVEAKVTSFRNSPTKMEPQSAFGGNPKILEKTFTGETNKSRDRLKFW